LTTQNDALKTQNQALLGQLNDAKTYQSGLMAQTKEAKKQNTELSTQNNGLLQTQKELQTANQSLRTSIKVLQSEQKQPPAPSMTQHDEQELLDLIDSKDKLIETLEKTVTKMRESLSMLNV
jgi:chromosome segregation ATPase